MKPRVLLVLSLLSPPFAESQGWYHFGPDSSGWQDVRNIDVRWFGSDSMYVAACTDEGIALKIGESPWDYTLRDAGDGTYIPYTWYRFLKFSPWEADSAFVGFEVSFIDPVPQLLKIPIRPWRPPIWESDAGGNCFGFLSEVFFPQSTDSILYALMCGVRKTTTPWRGWVTLLDSYPASPVFLATDRTHPLTLLSNANWGPPPVILHSVNGGVSWDTVTSFPFMPDGKGILSEGDTILLAQSSGAPGITRSTDAGGTWTPCYDQSGISILRWGKGQTVYAGGPAGILMSGDAGLTWNVFNNGLPGTFITDIMVDPNSDTLLVSVLQHGILKVWNYLVGVDQPSPRACSYSLQQNFPNPFNPSTSIAYSVGGVRGQGSGVSNVQLIVYDVLGREAAVLVNEKKAPGTYTVQFDGSKLASGVYFYRLQAGNFVETRKMVVVR